MPFSRQFRTHYRLLLSFFALTLLPASALVWMGWQFVASDRVAEQRRLEEHREGATDLIAAALQHAIATDEQRLMAPGAWQDIVADGAFVVVIDRHGVRTQPEPSVRLRYYPFIPERPEAPIDPFVPGEDEEHRRRNFAAAIELFQPLTRSEDPSIRAGAWLRLARNFRRIGKTEEALRAYRALAHERSAGLFGLPADLVGRHALCALLAELGSNEELRHEAQRLRADIRAGRWHLERGKYVQVSDDIGAWLGEASDAANLRWTAVTEILAQRWLESSVGDDRARRELVRAGSDSYAVLWRGSPERLVAFVASSSYVEERWLARIATVAAAHGMGVRLEDPLDVTPSTASVTERRVPSLPWTLVVETRDPHTAAGDVERRNAMLQAGLVLLLLLAVAGSYFVARAIARELALARLQSDFVSAVSHEFRTPLTALGQATEMLTEGRVTDPRGLARYHTAQARATTRLQRLVESLLDFGRMEAGSRPYRFDDVAAGELVQTVVEDFRNEMPSADHTIEVSVSGTDHVIKADPEALAHALRNLLDNAVKYSPTGGSVRVAVGKEGRHVAIRVSDDGLGIPPREQKRIFQKFVRGASAREHAIKGTGVGLALVSHIVRAHGGRIQVDSEVGTGSTFTMLLPE